MYLFMQILNEMNIVAHLKYLTCKYSYLECHFRQPSKKTSICHSCLQLKHFIFPSEKSQVPIIPILSLPQRGIQHHYLHNEVMKVTL